MNTNNHPAETPSSADSDVSVPQEEELTGRMIPTRKGIGYVDISGIEGGVYYEGDCYNLTQKFPMGIFDTVFLDPSYIQRAYDSGYVGNDRNPCDIHKSLPEDRYWSGELQREYPGVHRICVLLRDLYREDMMLWAVWLAWRILDTKRVLAQDGYLWLCCPEGMDHGMKLLMTAIFGNTRFQEILWTCPKNSGYIHQILDVENDPSKISISEPVFEREILSENEITLTEWDRKNSKHYNLPTALMRHILQKQTDENKFVLESFGGDGTFCRAAHALNHHWVYAEIQRNVSKGFIKDFVEPNGAKRLPRLVPTGDLQTRRTATDDLIKASLYLSQQGICLGPDGCGMTIPFREMTVDHIHPRSRGGPDISRNFRLLCKKCNGDLGDSNVPTQ